MRLPAVLDFDHGVGEAGFQLGGELRLGVRGWPWEEGGSWGRKQDKEAGRWDHDRGRILGTLSMRQPANACFRRVRDPTTKTRTSPI